MDSMDYTMDEAPSTANLPHTASGCQYNPSPTPSNAHYPRPFPREDRHYDPVHDATGWYPQSVANVQSRQPFQPPSPHVALSQWRTGTFTPSWQGLGEIQPGTQGQGQHPSDFRSQAASVGMHHPTWSELQGYDLPFGYSSHYTGSINRPNGGTQAHQTSERSSPHVPPANTDSTTLPFSSRPAQASNVPERVNMSRALSAGTSHTSFASGLGQQHTEMRFSSETGVRNAHSRISRANRMSAWLDSPTRRTRHSWDSNSDDEDDFEAAIEARHSELYFGSGGDEERFLAAYRGHLTSSKKVPTKEALASLEAVNLEDLTDDKVCSICYNEMGVSNPEGLVETPLRLPKCKHTFGDKCIKKWFEDSDSCPYCRDALPSEVPRRRTLALESMRQAQIFAQQQSRLAAVQSASQGHRVRHGGVSYVPPTEDTSRPSSHRMQDDYEYYSRVTADMWGSSFNRASPGDSSESRRRQARGRMGSNRTSHMLGRPTSVGSARFIINPSSNQQGVSARAQFFNNNGSHGSSHVSRRSITPSLTGHGSSPAIVSPNMAAQITPPRNRSSAFSEEASLPVANGSSDNAERQTHQSVQNVRRQVDPFSDTLTGDQRLGALGNSRSLLPLDIPTSLPNSRPGVQRSYSAANQSDSYSTPQLTSYGNSQIAQPVESRYISSENAVVDSVSSDSRPRWSQ